MPVYRMANTADMEFCYSHCLRILNYRLTLGELHSVGFRNYVNATIESHWLMRQKCISLYFKLFQDFVEFGGELYTCLHTSHFVNRLKIKKVDGNCL